MPRCSCAASCSSGEVMADKPKRASEYKPEQVELVRAACLYVATKLGDMMDDLVIIGGLVPSLIIDQDTPPAL